MVLKFNARRLSSREPVVEFFIVVKIKNEIQKWLFGDIYFSFEIQKLKKWPFKEKSLDTKKRVKYRSPSLEQNRCNWLSRTRMLTVFLDWAQMMDVKGLLTHSGWMELSNLEMLF